MSLRRRGTAAVGLAVAAALSLSACGSDDGGSGGSAKSEGGGDKKAAVATGGKDFADAAKKTAEYGTDAKAGQFPRTLTHAMGKTEIKSAPKRVVVLDVGEFDNVVSLGVKPVGYAPSEGDAAIPSYLKKEAGNPKNVGTINNLNLEAIAGLKPDLILGSQAARRRQVRRALQDRADRVLHPPGLHLEGELPPQRRGTGQDG